MEKTNLERHIVHRNANFATICTIAMHDETLSLEAQWLHTKIFLLPPSWQFSIKGLSKITGVSAYKIKNALRELEEHGYLIRSHLRDSETGQYVVNEYGVGTQYDFYEEPVTAVNTPAEPVDPRQITMEQYLGGEDTKPEKPARKEKTKSDYTEEFEEAWEAYGKVGTKSMAAKAYKKARKTASREEIAEGIKAYRVQQEIRKTERKFIKHFATWLNNACWLDDYETTAPATKQAKKPQRHEEQQPSGQAEKNYDYGFNNKKIEFNDDLSGLWI